MKLIPFDTREHRVSDVADLIYETDIGLMQFIFGKNREKARAKIGKLIMAGNNSFGKENISVALDGEEIVGIAITHSTMDHDTESKVYSKNFGLWDLMKLGLVVEPAVKRLLTTEISSTELYLSNLCVDGDRRGQGVGGFIMEKVIEMAREKGYNRVVLDVSADNPGAKRFYDRVGFVVTKERHARILGEKAGTFQMVYELDA